MAPPNRDELLAAVERSPQAAAAHDRAGWVGLFTGDARVEDPVGSQPQVGHEAIGRFYDTFIGPRDITFIAIWISSPARWCCAISNSRSRWTRL